MTVPVPANLANMPVYAKYGPRAKHEFSGFAIGRKCVYKNFNTYRNCMK